MIEAVRARFRSAGGDAGRRATLARLVLATAVVAAAAVAQGAGKPATEKKEDPIRHYEIGLQYLNQARPDRAAEEFERAVALDPGSTPFQYGLGLAYMGTRDWKRAEKAFQRLLALDPSFTDAHNNLGILYSEQQNWDAAKSEWERCLADSRYQTPEVARFNIGRMLVAAGRHADAIAHFKLAVDAKPDRPDWRFAYAAALVDAGRISEGIIELELTVKARPDWVEALFSLGTVSRKAGNETRARECLGRVVALAPGTPLAARAAELLATPGA